MGEGNCLQVYEVNGFGSSRFSCRKQCGFTTTEDQLLQLRDHERRCRHQNAPRQEDQQPN